MPGTRDASTGISKRVGAVRESAILAIERQVRELTGAGHSIISFAAGEPDFATPAEVVEAAIHACSDFRMQHYTPAAGLPDRGQDPS